MGESSDYKVKLDIFEGPLELLLHLIKKEEVNIQDIPIVKITDQYLEYLNLMRVLNLGVAGEFLVMAATLMHIKSRMLLPPEQRQVNEEEDEDPRGLLVRQLLEYEKFKDAASLLDKKEGEASELFYAPGEDAAGFSDGQEPVFDVSLFDLLGAFSSLLKKPQEEFVEIVQEKITVAEKIEAILGLVRLEKNVNFSKIFLDAASRIEMIVTFLALLELVRLKKLAARQTGRFGEVFISLNEH